VEDLRRNADQPVVGNALDDIRSESTGCARSWTIYSSPHRSGPWVRRTDRPVRSPWTLPTASRPPAAGVRIEVDAGHPTSGDPARLRQLVTILVDNAIRRSAASTVRSA
jgi:signal transduction histidine kinase